MRVAGIDLSTHAIDLVAIQADEDENGYQPCEWLRVALVGDNAFARTLSIREMFQTPSWFEDVAVVCLEEPYGRGKVGATSALNRVLGSITASLPSQLRWPDRCWLVAPHEWRSGLGLQHNQKPTALDLGEHGFAGFDAVNHAAAQLIKPDQRQDARDAWALARWAMNELDKAAAAA